MRMRACADRKWMSCLAYRVARVNIEALNSRAFFSKKSSIELNVTFALAAAFGKEAIGSAAVQTEFLSRSSSVAAMCVRMYVSSAVYARIF